MEIRPARLVMLVVALVSTAPGCARAPGPGGTEARYTPQAREITITTVPLLTREMQSVYPFLRRDFAPGGVVAGKEVYAFVPSTITCVAGDTLHLTFLNPEDDEHAFVLPDFFVPLPGQSRKDTTYVARRPGIFVFSCSMPAHLPMMRGELVVLAPERLAGPPAGPPGRGSGR